MPQLRSPASAAFSTPSSSPTTTSSAPAAPWRLSGSGARSEIRFHAAQVDASDPEDVAGLIRMVGATHVLNAVDRASSCRSSAAASPWGELLRHGHVALAAAPTEPFSKPHVKLGDEQFAMADEWEAAGPAGTARHRRRARPVGRLARYAADHLFAHRGVGTRDGSNLAYYRPDGTEGFAPGFSMWTIIEECLNPPVVWEKARRGRRRHRSRLLHPATVQRARGIRTSPGRDRTGGSACRSSTRGGAPSCRVGSMRAGHLLGNGPGRADDQHSRALNTPVWTRPSRSRS